MLRRECGEWQRRGGPWRRRMWREERELYRRRGRALVRGTAWRRSRRVIIPLIVLQCPGRARRSSSGSATPTDLCRPLQGPTQLAPSQAAAVSAVCLSRRRVASRAPDAHTTGVTISCDPRRFMAHTASMRSHHSTAFSACAHVDRRRLGVAETASARPSQVPLLSGGPYRPASSSSPQTPACASSPPKRALLIVSTAPPGHRCPSCAFPGVCDVAALAHSPHCLARPRHPSRQFSKSLAQDRTPVSPQPLQSLRVLLACPPAVSWVPAPRLGDVCLPPSTSEEHPRRANSSSRTARPSSHAEGVLISPLALFSAEGPNPDPGLKHFSPGNTVFNFPRHR
ncbi:hypothetical protein BV20DRAFT_295290 [Pilatotrama ljubarskyi]|nr:hypothetical protein BV20DRAFT_295290 [Pilatotrama ljubarskyi]